MLGVGDEAQGQQDSGQVETETLGGRGGLGGGSPMDSGDSGGIWASPCWTGGVQEDLGESPAGFGGSGGIWGSPAGVGGVRVFGVSGQGFSRGTLVGFGVPQVVLGCLFQGVWAV